MAAPAPELDEEHEGVHADLDEEDEEEDLEELQDFESRGFAGAGGEYGDEEEDDDLGRGSRRDHVEDDEF